MKKRQGNKENQANETGIGLTKDLDALFVLPLTEFTAGRNALAAKLKRDGRSDEAGRVKALAKPSISAWTANQLYWRHREVFDRLIATGTQVRQAQVSLIAGKLADIREPLDARRAALSDLSRLAAAILRDAGQNPTQDKLSRIATTLEAMSVLASLPNAPDAGHLTNDVDPPGFDALTLSFPGVADAPAPVDTNAQPATVRNARNLGETRQAKIAAAKVLLQESEQRLGESRTAARSAETALKKADEDAKHADRHALEAKARFEEASALSEEAATHARNVAADLKRAEKAVADAERTVEKASQELTKMRSD